ncbi:hypothetical protein KP509_03G076400 [Ceratopteris richardii]|uniref:DUF659 domain-containing protein n=1 Tax=Ceratopteris richardii TaxID=49495 RepID=A0A8T2V588_CERRI|nr:hypothetical protein KP509_03G076400 [Ceratopteris richardii]
MVKSPYPLIFIALMAPPLHEAFHKHCVAFERVKDKSNVCRWHCKYCGRIQTSSVTRVLIHLCKLSGECSPCNGIPDDIYEKCRKKYLPLKRRKGSLPQHEVVSPDHDNIGIGNAPSISIGSVAPTMSSHECEEGTSLPKRNKGVCESGSGSSRQPTLAQVSGGVSGTLTFLKERQKVAEIEIARTIIDVSYNDMRTKKLDEEKARIDRSLEPVRAGWAKYGCSILSDGWSDRKKRGIINIFVSCPLGTFSRIGHQHVIQVITDNASNCASMGRKLEQEFPSIVWSPRTTHCLDLLMEDSGKLEWVKSITSKAISIVNFINAKMRVLAIYRSYSDLELKKPSKTRFAAMWILLDHLFKVQNKLQKTIVSEEFKEWLDGEPIAQQQEAKAMQRLCLKESFWRSIHGLVIAILPLYKVLRMTNMEGATIGRWKWMKRLIHGFAALLHPAFEEPSLFMDSSLLEDRDTYLRKILSANDHGKFLQDFINYNDQRGGALALSLVWKRDSLVKPIFWWESFGYQMPRLKRCAMRILAKDFSSGVCERNRSAYSLIHTKIRNKLSTMQLERLTYCCSNLRMPRSMHEMPMARQSELHTISLNGHSLWSMVPLEAWKLHFCIFTEWIE